MAKRKSKRSGPRPYRGLPVEDSTELLHAVVTDIDIRASETALAGLTDKEMAEAWPEHCPLAEALRRTIPGLVTVFVHRSVTMLVFEDHCVRSVTSQPARDQIIRNDGPARSFDPGVYPLLPVSPSMIASRGVRHTPTDLKHGAPNSPHKRPPPHNLGRVALTYDA